MQAHDKRPVPTHWGPPIDTANTHWDDPGHHGMTGVDSIAKSAQALCTYMRSARLPRSVQRSHVWRPISRSIDLYCDGRNKHRNASVSTGKQKERKWNMEPSSEWCLACSQAAPELIKFGRDLVDTNIHASRRTVLVGTWDGHFPYMSRVIDTKSQ